MNPLWKPGTLLHEVTASRRWGRRCSNPPLEILKNTPVPNHCSAPARRTHPGCPRLNRRKRLRPPTTEKAPPNPDPVSAHVLRRRTRSPGPALPRSPVRQLRRALAAVRILATLGPAAEPAVPALVAALRDPDIAVRTLTARALAAVGRAAVLPLVEAMQEDDVDLRKAIITTLALIGPAAAAAMPVLRAAVGDEHLGPSAAQALRRIERTPLAVVLARVEALMPMVLLIAGVFLAMAGGAAGLTWVGAEFFPASGGAAATAAFGVGILGAVLGGLVGAHRYGSLGAASGAVLLGLGGGLTGLVLGGVLGTTMGPINHVLGRR